jgi:hypothetical protein
MIAAVLTLMVVMAVLAVEIGWLMADPAKYVFVDGLTVINAIGPQIR